MTHRLEVNKYQIGSDAGIHRYGVGTDIPNGNEDAKF